jgi:multiple sugar transport system substrate-binding protein
MDSVPNAGATEKAPRMKRLLAVAVAVTMVAAACGNQGGGNQTTAPTGGGATTAPTTAPTGGGATTAPTTAPTGGGESPAPTGGGGGQIQPPATQVSLDFWNPFTGPDGEFMKQLVDQFNQQTPNVQIKVTRQADIYAKYRAAAQANRLPHIGIFHVDAVAANADILTPISDLAEQLALTETDFTPEVWNGGVWKGERYVIPLDIHTLTFYWNKDLFRKAGLDPEKPPTNREEFLQAARTITQKGAGQYYGYNQIVSNNFLAGIMWATLFYQGGGQLCDPANCTTATINDTAGVQAAAFMAELGKPDISAPNVAGDTELANFKAGKNAMVFAGMWETTGFAGIHKENLGAGPVPNFFGEGVWAGSHQFAVTKRQMSAEERQGAYYFISWMSQQSDAWAAAGQIPARASQRETEAFKALPHIPTIAQQAANAKFPPQIPAISDVIFGPKGAGEHALLAVTGKLQPQQAMDAAAAQYTKFLQEQKTKYGY